MFRGSLGGGRKEATTTTYTVKLGVPPGIEADVDSVSTDDYLEKFIAALTQIVSDADQYRVSDLATNEISASLRFFIQEKGGVGLENEFEVVPVSVKAGSSTTNERTQMITLKFESDTNALQ